MDLKKLFMPFLFFLAFSGCIGEDLPDELHYVSSKPQLKHCNSHPSVETREICYFNKSLEISAPILCEEIGGISLRNTCLMRLGIRLNDPKVCMKILKDDAKYTECMTRLG